MTEPGSKPLRVLLVEDSPTDAKLIERMLRRQLGDCETLRVDDEPQLESALQEPWDLVLCDWGMPRFSGSRALEVTRKLSPDSSFIIVSGTVGEEAAADAVRRGAADFVSKNRLERLGAVVERELRDRDERLAHRRTREALAESEQKLQQAQKMEAIGTLAGGIAHDFNNLLTVILGYAEQIDFELPEGSPAAEGVEQIRLAATRASELTRRLLAFGRRQVLRPRIMTLNQVVEGVRPMLERVLGEDIELAVRLAQTPDTCRIDPSQLEQVLMNLVVNARDAMPQGGQLRIETRNVPADDDSEGGRLASAAGDYVQLRVADSGCGMTEDVKARIFEPFFTTKAVDRGTGLGLATVFGIVHQSGGYISVDSELGQGTTFELFFPVSRGEVAPEPQGHQASASGGEETILLAEDNDQVRALLYAFLARAGYHVLRAPNGAAALQLARDHNGPIHLLCTDVVMPGMSGRQLADKLLELRPETRVLFVSGYPGTAMEHHGVLDGGSPLLQKPLTRSAVLSKVRQLLDECVHA